LFIHITLETAPNEMQCDETINVTRQSGYSRPILFPHSAKRIRDCRQNHHDCRQNIPWLLWNALLTTPYVSEHYKYMFLVATDLYEMFVLYRGKHTTRGSTVGIWSEVRVYRTPATKIPRAGVLRLGMFPDNRRSMGLVSMNGSQQQLPFVDIPLLYNKSTQGKRCKLSYTKSCQ